jgi:hypothetical protein
MDAVGIGEASASLRHRSEISTSLRSLAAPLLLIFSILVSSRKTYICRAKGGRSFGQSRDELMVVRERLA